MKNFRELLLKLLMENPDTMVDIMPLVNEMYAGEDIYSFEEGDKKLIQFRLSINIVLREMTEMGWLNIYPTSGLSSAHKYNHNTGKREFILNQPVSARLTTRGLVEYKNHIRESIVNNQTIGTNYGIATQGSQFFGGLDNNSIIHSNTPQNTHTDANSGKVSLMAKIWELISNNKLISSILSLLISAAIYYYLKDKIPFLKELHK